MDGQEVQQLLHTWGKDVFRFCSSLAGNQPDTEDLYQQTFLKLLEMDGDIQWEKNPRSYVFAVANGIWKNEIRKKARRGRIAPSVSIHEENANLLAGEDSTEAEVERKVQMEELAKILHRLREKIRTPIILYYQFDESVEEIAKILNIPAGTVKSRLYKGRKTIQKEMEEKGYETAEE